MDEPIYILTDKRVVADVALSEIGIPRHAFQSPSGSIRIATSPDRLHGVPRGFRYCVIGDPRPELLEAAWARDGEEITLDDIKETSC